MKFSISIFLCLLFVSSAFSAGLVDISYSGITITQPGSYIVVDNLTTAQNMNAITIICSDVTIDLNGHTLYGAGTAVGTAGTGIYSFSTCVNIAIENGTIRDFRNYGISLGGLNCQVSRIRAYRNGSGGIKSAGMNGTVTDCSAENNNGIGIEAGNSFAIKNCSANNNLADGIYGNWGCSITNCVTRQNGDNGIEALHNSTIIGNASYYNVGDGISTGFGSVVKDNSIRDCNGRGINAGSSCNISGNGVYSCDSHGINANSACTITGNSLMNNGGAGIYALTANTIKDNTVESNTIDGIRVTDDCQIVGNTVDGHSGNAGINVTGSGNLIAHNNVTDNGFGILCDPATGNYLHSNSANGNTTTGFDINLGNTTYTGDRANVSF